MYNLYENTFYLLSHVFFTFQGAILSTPDITLEGFGFMLAFGDLVWVPFIFSIQSRFLAEHTREISWLHALLVFALNSKLMKCYGVLASKLLLRKHLWFSIVRGFFSTTSFV